MNENFEYKKRFYDLEKEESWLNEMSEKGLLLKSVKYGFFKDTYTFEHCEKKYIFRLDYTKDGIVFEEFTSPYVMFVTSTYKADYVCYMNGKVYFRKSAESGEFPPIYTDPESRLLSEKKRFGYCTSLALLCISSAVYIFVGTNVPSAVKEGDLAAITYSLIMCGMWLSAFIPCFIRSCKHYKKMQEIKNIMNDKLEYKKRFYDLEKEESWLNEMSEKGLLLKSVKWGVFRDTYTFDHCEKKYIFRLDYTKDGVVFEEFTSPYVMFVTSTYKADYVCYMNGKVYFRKSAESGEFPPIYSDPESRLLSEKKRFGYFITLTMVFIFEIVSLSFGTNILSGISEGNLAAIIYYGIMFALCLFIIISCFSRAVRHYKKIRDIKKIMKE